MNLNRNIIFRKSNWFGEEKVLFYSHELVNKKGGRPSAGGSHMSGVWGREKLRQAFPPQNLRRGCFEPVTWWLSETALTTALGLPFPYMICKRKLSDCLLSYFARNVTGSSQKQEVTHTTRSHPRCQSPNSKQPCIKVWVHARQPAALSHLRHSGNS